jgi:hypothetical protein
MRKRAESELKLRSERKGKKKEETKKGRWR